MFFMFCLSKCFINSYDHGNEGMPVVNHHSDFCQFYVYQLLVLRMLYIELQTSEKCLACQVLVRCFCGISSKNLNACLHFSIYRLINLSILETSCSRLWTRVKVLTKLIILCYVLVRLALNHQRAAYLVSCWILLP